MGNKRRISLTKKILFIVLSFMVVSQLTCLYIDIRAFERNYVGIINSNLYVVGASIKNNLDSILEKGIPINKLIGLKPYFNEVLSDAPNLSFLAVYDDSGRCLYYSDRNKSLEDYAADQAGKAIAKSESGNRFILSFPLRSTGEVKGKLVTGIDQKLISKQLRSVILDTGTVILISILATIDFLFFIVALTIEIPLKRAANDISLAKNPERIGLLIGRTGIEFFDYELERFDRYRYNFITKWLRFKELFLSFDRALKYRNIKDPAVYQPVKEIRSVISRFSTERKVHTGSPAIIGLPVLIRPSVFLFVFAEALSISFLPLYAQAIYRPIWGLGKEVIIGLPISAFMLFTALSFPLGGALSDTFGYRKSFITGVLITSTGLFLSGSANDILHLVFYRCLVGAGFGIAFITAQSYIVSTTFMSNRAEGMAVFLSAFYGGTLCGSAIGGMVAERIGYTVLFQSGAIIILISGFFTYLFISEQVETEKQWKPGAVFKRLKSFLPLPRDFIKLLSNRNFAALTFLQSIPNKICLIGFVYYIAPLFLKSLNSSQSDTGRCIMSYSLMMILFSQTASKWSDRYKSAKPFVFWGGILSGLSLIPFFFFSNIWMVATGILFLGLSHTISVSNQAKMASQLEVVQEIGVGPGLGIYRQMERIGNVLAPVLLGFLSSIFGYPKTLAFTGIATVVLSLVFQIIYREKTVASHGN